MFYGICFLHIIPQKKCVFFLSIFGVAIYTPPKISSTGCEVPSWTQIWRTFATGAAISQGQMRRRRRRQRRTCWKTRWEKHENSDVYICLLLYNYIWDNYNYHHIITISWDLDVISITRSPKILAVFLAFGVFNRIPWPADGAPVRRSNLGALTEFSTDGGSMKLDQREKHLQPKCTGILWFCRPWSPSGRSFCVTEWVFGPVLCQPGIDVSGPDIESRTCKTWMFLAKVRIQTAFGDNVFGPWSRCTKSLNSLCMEKGWNNQWSTGERCKKGQKIETKSERHGKSKPISPTGGNIETKTSAKSLILLSWFPVSSKLINYNFEKVNN